MPAGSGAALASGGDNGSGDDRDDDNSASGSDDGGDNSGKGRGGDDDDDSDKDEDGGGGRTDGGQGGTGGTGGQGGSESGGSESVGGKSGGGKSGGSGDYLVLQFNDGHTEIVRRGQFERKDGAGRVVERRPATGADLRRPSGYGASDAGRARLKSLIMVSSSRNALQVIDLNGWSELVENGRHQLNDPNGNLVAKRAATQDEVVRIRAMAGF